MMLAEARRKQLDQKRIEEIKALMAKLSHGFKQSGSDWAAVDDLGLTDDEKRELRSYIHYSKKKEKEVIFAKSIMIWLQKSGALEASLFMPGVGTEHTWNWGSRSAQAVRTVKGAWAGASPAEIKAAKKGKTVLKEPTRPFEGSPYGQATHQQPIAGDISLGRGEARRRASKGYHPPEKKKESMDEGSKKDLNPLDSKTATTLRYSLFNSKHYKGFTDDDWIQFGQFVKSKGMTKSAFTGSLQELLKYVNRNPRGFPVTDSYVMKAMIRLSEMRMKNLSAPKIMGILEGDGLVESAKVTTKEALKANHTIDDENEAKENPRKLKTIWFPGEGLKDIIAFLGKKKVLLRIEGAELRDKKLFPYEIHRLAELLECPLGEE